MGKSRYVIRITALVVAAAMILGGCTATAHEDTGVPDGADLELYDGAMPPPVQLPEWPLPDPPTPPTDVTDFAAMISYSEDMAVYQTVLAEKQVELGAFYDGVESAVAAAKLGGEQSLAAWQSLLVTAGIAVTGADGAPVDVNGNTGFGWAMTDPELRLHAVLAAAPGGLRLVDLVEVLQSIPELAPLDATALLTALSVTGDPLFDAVLTSFEPEVFHTADFQVKPVDEVVLSWAQVSLVIRRLSAEITAVAAGQSGGGAFVDRPVPSSRSLHASPASYNGGPVFAQGGSSGCDLNIDTPWIAELVNQFNKAHSVLVFDGAIQLIDEQLESNFGRKIGIARVISAFATMLAKMAALRASFTLDNAPLVRTKDTQVGELRQLTIAYSFAEQPWEKIRGCMNLLLGPFGFEVPGSKSGAAGDIDVTLWSEEPARLRVGDGRGGTASVNLATTDSSGKATFTLSGAPQPEKIPDQAEPEDVEVTLRAVSNLGGNDFFKDMASLPWDALDAFSTGGISLIPTMLSRMKLLTFTGTVPVRDWSLEVDFEATLVASLTARRATNTQTGGGCTPAVHTFTSSTELSSSIASDMVPVTAVLLTNPDGGYGDQATVFVPTGQEFVPFDFGNGVWMFDMPANYSTTKTHAEPGIPPLPEKYVHPPSPGCGDGGGGGGGEPPAPDCGVRNYTGTVEVTVPKPRTLLTSDKSGGADDPWSNCGPQVPWLVPTAENCQSAQTSGGKMPPIADIFDPSKAVLEVTGALTCSETGTGSMRDFTYEWTLVLCRVDEDGKSAC